MVSYLPGDPPPQLAFSITRKVGPAVVRNRVRRQLRASFRELARSGAVRGGSFLIRAEPVIVEHSFDQMGEDLHRALESAGALS